MNGAGGRMSTAHLQRAGDQAVAACGLRHYHQHYVGVVKLNLMSSIVPLYHCDRVSDVPT
jgi:hypothetical protein